MTNRLFLLAFHKPTIQPEKESISPLPVERKHIYAKRLLLVRTYVYILATKTDGRAKP